MKRITAAITAAAAVAAAACLVLIALASGGAAMSFSLRRPTSALTSIHPWSLASTGLTGSCPWRDITRRQRSCWMSWISASCPTRRDSRSCWSPAAWTLRASSPGQRRKTQGTIQRKMEAADTAITGKRKRRADTGTSERRTVFKFPELQARGSIRYQNALQDILNGVSAFSSPEYRFRKNHKFFLF